MCRFERLTVTNFDPLAGLLLSKRRYLLCSCYVNTVKRTKFPRITACALSLSQVVVVEIAPFKTVQSLKVSVQFRPLACGLERGVFLMSPVKWLVLSMNWSATSTLFPRIGLINGWAVDSCEFTAIRVIRLCSSAINEKVQNKLMGAGLIETLFIFLLYSVPPSAFLTLFPMSFSTHMSSLSELNR